MINVSSPINPSVLNMATNVGNQPTVSLPVSTGGDGGGGVAGAADPGSSGGKSPSFLERLLPTIGGVGGGILGGLLSGGVASVGGAAGGAALGQALENKLEGESALQTNDLTSGAENGVGDLVGLGAGKLVGGIGEGLANAGAKGTQKIATDEADQVAAQEQTAKVAAQKAEVQRTADEFKPHINDPTVTPKIGQTVDSLRVLGYDKPVAQDAVNVGNVLTGSNDNGAGIINQEKQAILNSAGGKVEVGQFGNSDTPAGKLYQSLQDPTTQAELGDPLDVSAKSPASAILNKYNILANGAGVPAEGSGAITPSAGFKLLNNISDQVREATKVAGKIGGTTADSSKAAVWTTLKNSLKDALYNRPEVNGAVSGYQVTPEVEGQIDKKMAAEGVSDPAIATNLKQHIVNTLNDGDTMQDWLNAEQEGVNMSKVGSSALKQQGNISSAASQRLAKGAIDEANPEVDPDMVSAPGKGMNASSKETDTLDALAHGASMVHPGAGVGVKLLQKAHVAGLTPKIAEKMGTALAKTAPLIAPAATALSNGPNIADSGTSAIPSNGTGASMIPSTTGVPDTTGGAAPPPTSLQSILATLLAQEQAAPTVLGPSLASTIGTLGPAVQKNQLASDTVSNLEPSFANAGGAQGLGGGLLSRLTSLIPGTAANTYQAQQQAAATQLAAVLGITPQAALAMLPQLMNNPQVAGQQQAGVGSILNTLTPSMATAQ